MRLPCGVAPRDRLRRGPIWYAGPDAVRNAVSFAKYTSRSRSRWAIIRVFDEAGNVTEAHEQWDAYLFLRCKLVNAITIMLRDECC